MININRRSDGDYDVEFAFEEKHIVVLFRLLKGTVSNESFKDLPPTHKEVILDLYTKFTALHSILTKDD